VTARSAWVLTVVIALAWLLSELASCVVALLTLTVLVMTVLLGVLGLTWTTKVKTSEAPGARLGLVAVTWPVPPGRGVPAPAVQPSGTMNETNVVLFGVASVRLTFCEMSGPPLVTVIE